MFPIELNENGQENCILRHFSLRFSAMHWHSDMPGIPDEAAVLAASAGCPRQIIRFKHNVYGLQCHLESNEEQVRNLLNQEKLISGRYIQSKQELLNNNYNGINQYMFLFLEYFSKLSLEMRALC